jgi:hypothetical protein
VNTASQKQALFDTAWSARFAAEKAALALLYCGLFKFWRDCRDKSCRRHRRCCGDAGECLGRRVGAIGRAAQFRARQTVLAATPRNAGPAERTARQIMPEALGPSAVKTAGDE